MTKSQVDRLGARLRAGDLSDADLRTLDEYRRSFAGAYDHVMGRLRSEFGLTPTGRAAKSTFAIVGKLQRESVRLSQIQDIAGCRLVVLDVPAQDAVVRTLAVAFPSASVIDRRAHPSHGYRAVHLVVTVDDLPVEIQVRTAVQQVWAEISEKLSDQFGIGVKYGEGNHAARTILDETSRAVAQIEDAEAKIDDAVRKLDEARTALRQTLDSVNRIN